MPEPTVDLPAASTAARPTTWLRRRLARAVVDAGLARLDLRWRFRCVVFAFGMPFFVYMVWSAAHQAAMEKDAIRGQARADATLLAARFEDHIGEIDRLLGTTAESVGSRMQDPVALNRLVQGLRSYMPKGVDNVAVWGLDGRNVAALDRRSLTRNVDVSDRRYFVDALARRELAFEGPMRSRSTGVDIVQFAHPIFGPNNEPIGVISIACRPAELIGLLDPTGRITDRSLVTIVDRGGRIVARSVDPASWVDKEVGDRDQLEAAFVRREGSQEEVDSDGDRRLVGFAVVDRWPWLVEVGEPIARVLDPASVALLTHLAIGLAIFGIAFVLAGRVAETIVAPLMRLASDTERLGRGELSHRSAVESGGEVAILAGNINRMAIAIEERDAALAASRAQLRAIADNMPAQICYLDRDERFRYVNRFVSAGIPDAGDIVGRTLRSVRGEAVYAILKPSVQRALGGQPAEVEVSRVDGDDVHHLHCAYVPDRAEDGTVIGIYAFAQDITERKNAEMSRAESEKRLVTITDNLPAMICYVDGERRFRFANRAHEKWLERPLDGIIGQRFDDLLEPRLAARFDEYFMRGMSGRTCEYELETESRDGASIWLKCVFVPDVDTATGRVRGVYGMTSDVTRAKLGEQRLTRLAQIDTLTGLVNRHRFGELLEAALGRRGDGAGTLALMFLDIDGFKQVNDRHGHGAGDELLAGFAMRLVDSVRSGDVVARLSGDEFVVLLDGLHSDDEPQFVARKIVVAVDKPFVLDDRTVRVTASIGIAMLEDRDETASALMKRADCALYEAKRNGRNQFRLAR